MIHKLLDNFLAVGFFIFSLHIIAALFLSKIGLEIPFLSLLILGGISYYVGSYYVNVQKKELPKKMADKIGILHYVLFLVIGAMSGIIFDMLELPFYWELGVLILSPIIPSVAVQSLLLNGSKKSIRELKNKEGKNNLINQDIKNLQ